MKEEETQEFVPMVFIEDGVIYQTLDPNRGMPVGKWLFWGNPPEWLNSSFYMKVADVYQQAEIRK